MSKIDKVYTALVEDRERLTAKQIAHRFSLANPYDAVYKIRRKGYVVNLDAHTDTKNRVKLKYSFSQNTHAHVALAYKAKAMGLA